MLWTEMTDDLAESVNGGYHCHQQSYYYCEKPKKEYHCESYKEPSYSWKEKGYNNSNYYQSKW